ncbi:MAG: cytoplasmic protein [Dehalococcoidia bacterium]
MADAITAAPDLYTVIEENDRVRILMYSGGPGSASEMHEHPDLVAIAITDAHVRFTDESGESMELNLPAGAAMFDSAKSHSTEVLSGESKVILVELK